MTLNDEHFSSFLGYALARAHSGKTQIASANTTLRYRDHNFEVTQMCVMYSAYVTQICVINTSHVTHMCGTLIRCLVIIFN